MERRCEIRRGEHARGLGRRRSLASGTSGQRRRGAAVIYVLVAMVGLTAIVSLAVDLGRVQLVKTELSGAADAAARAGAKVVNLGANNARAAAIAAAGYCTADGSKIVLKNGDIKVGTWDATTRTFSNTGTGDTVQVTVSRTQANGNPISLAFGRLIGKTAMDVTVVSTAERVTTPLPSFATNKSNPWLAGMPDGTTANGYDAAPTASPTQLKDLQLTNGANLTFDVSGQTTNQTGVEQMYDPDGNTGWIISNYSGAEHGVANLNAPISSLVAVFLDDTRPDISSAPPTLDFSTAAKRDFTSLSPMLKQPFFIGDGKTSGGTLQKFVVPNGATRLYVGSMDGQQWSDNGGGFSVTVKGVSQSRVITVQ